MAVMALAALGVVVGAAGSELLRAKRPELVAKIDQAARRLVDAIYPTPPTDESTEDQDPRDRMR
jgi:hypothetical protein